jgi:hypothetical protein
MSCLRAHDFISGTTITLPRSIIRREASNELWDILRPNEKAARLVSLHCEALQALNAARQPEAAI